MKTRVLTSVLIVLLVLYPALAGGWAFGLLAASVIIAASLEWVQWLPDCSQWRWLVLCPLTAMLFIIYLLASMPRADLVFPCAALLLVYLWSLPVFVPSYSEQTCFTVISFALIMGCVLWSIGRMTLLGQPYFWTLLLATYGSDTGAYFAGRFFGRHKMAPRISPKKTWEGFFGGWALGFLLSFGISLFYESSLNSTLNLLLCIMAPVFAELGDLCFSAYKRAHDIKDFSSILPGHGGVLDRIDSLLMNFILFGILSYLIF